jgi:DNA polymerase-1
LKERTLYLVDGTYNVYRAFHATPRLTTSKGQPTNAVFAFANILRKLTQSSRAAAAAQATRLGYI